MDDGLYRVRKQEQLRDSIEISKDMGRKIELSEHGIASALIPLSSLDRPQAQLESPLYINPSQKPKRN